MNRLRRVAWLAFGAVAVSAPLFWLLRRPLLPSLVSAAQVLWRFYSAVPPIVLWLGLLLILYLMAALGWLALALSGFWSGPARAVQGAPLSEGRVAVLLRWVKRRQRGPYSRHFLKQRVTEIGVAKLAQVHRAAPAQIKAALEAKALGLPPEVNAYLVEGLSPWPAEPLGWWRELGGRLGLRRPVAPAETGRLEQVLDFLESL